MSDTPGRQTLKPPGAGRDWPSPGCCVRALTSLISGGWEASSNSLFSSTMKRTYQPSKIRRARTHGFLVRMKSRGGRAVINARRAKGCKKLTQV